MAAGGTCAKVVVILAAIWVRAVGCAAAALLRSRKRDGGAAGDGGAGARAEVRAPRAARGCQPGARSKGRPSLADGARLDRHKPALIHVSMHAHRSGGAMQYALRGCGRAVRRLQQRGACTSTDEVAAGGHGADSQI